MPKNRFGRGYTNFREPTFQIGTNVLVPFSTLHAWRIFAGTCYCQAKGINSLECGKQTLRLPNPVHRIALFRYCFISVLRVEIHWR